MVITMSCLSLNLTKPYLSLVFSRIDVSEYFSTLQEVAQLEGIRKCQCIFDVSAKLRCSVATAPQNKAKKQSSSHKGATYFIIRKKKILKDSKNSSYRRTIPPTTSLSLFLPFYNLLRSSVADASSVLLYSILYCVSLVYGVHNE